ncbi:MAG TPA: hypothetical protein PLM75_06710 [bacterium]|nr:hypothetical protein [bacterium]HPP87533.1 hypothetical protein [bacterium]
METQKKIENEASLLLKQIKNKCSELGISLIFDKLENDGGSCKYKNKLFIVINKFYSDIQKLSIFFSEISKTEYNSQFEDLKNKFSKLIEK